MDENVIRLFFQQNRISARSVLAAVSGGSDSCALLHCLCKVREQLGIVRLAVAHVNHGLRGDESDGEEAFVREQAEKLGCALFLERLEGRTLHSSGIEQWARNCRYRFFASVRELHGFDVIATAHTANDQAETVVMNCARGAGLRGIRGIAPVREDGVIRPLLGVTREQCREWLRARGVSWIEDSSNDDLRFRRNLIRHRVLRPLETALPGAVERIADIAAEARAAYAMVAEKTNKIINDCVFEKNKNMFFVIKKALIKEGAYCAGQALAEIFRRRSIAVTRDRIAEVVANVSRCSGVFLLDSGWRYYPWRDRFEFVQGDEAEGGAFMYKLALPGETALLAAGASITADIVAGDDAQPRFDPGNMRAFLDADCVASPLVFRSIRGDDRFRPFGSSQSYSCNGYLKKQRVGARERSKIGVVVQKNGEIIWIPTVAIAHPFHVRESTRRIITISFRHV